MTQEPVQRRSREELQLLAVREILRASATALPLDEILTVIANMTIIVFDATTSWFMLAEDGTLRTAIARGEFAEEMQGRTCKIKTGESRVAITGARPVILQPGEVDPADPIIGSLAQARQPVVLLPLQHAGGRLGLLGSAVTPEASLDISFLVTMAEQAAAAIETWRLREETLTWRQRLDAVFERMAEAVLIFDSRGQLALMNASAKELLEPRGVQLGDSVADLAQKAGLCDSQGRPMRPEETASARALRGERVENLEQSLPIAESATCHLLASAVPLGAHGRPQGAVVVWRNITHIKELERMRAQFLSMVSHELRSPLTSILGFAQLLRRDIAINGEPRDLDRRLGTIVEQARRVNSLVEDLLDISRAEAGQLTLSRDEVSLPELIQQTVNDRATLAPSHRLRVEVCGEVPALWADAKRIEQVLRNLLSNAVKFSPAETEIVVRLEGDSDRLVVAVADQGWGIAKEDIATLFVPFHRLHQPSGHEVKGTGLGLLIARSIVEAHGGEMWVHSQPHKGSTFYFSLPIES